MSSPLYHVMSHAVGVLREYVDLDHAVGLDHARVRLRLRDRGRQGGLAVDGSSGVVVVSLVDPGLGLAGERLDRRRCAALVVGMPGSAVPVVGLGGGAVQPVSLQS
jgi:hypothetical protein